MDDACTRYALDVVEGRVPAGWLVRAACQRHLDDLAGGAARGLRWSPGRARHALDFFGNLCLPDSTGTPFRLTPYEAFWTGSIFGWLDADGTRRFRTVYIETAKGSGKSPWGAAVGLYGLLADGEAAPEVYVGATTYKQAFILFRDAKLLIESSPKIARRLKVDLHNIANLAAAGFFRPVAADNRSLDGPRPHIAIVDELHEHRDGLVTEKLRAGFKRRRQPLLIMLTNAGYDRTSYCWEQHRHAVAVLAGGRRDDSFFAYVAALDPCASCRDEGREQPAEDCPRCDSWRDPAVWEKANPGVPHGLPTRKYLAEQVGEAEGRPGKTMIVQRLNFNLWNEASRGWLPMSAWDECAGPVDAQALRGRPCYGGLDLARVKDLSALVLLFPPEDGGEPWKVLAWYYVPEDDVRERTRRDHVPYDLWVRQGHVEATPGNTTDYDYIREAVLEAAGAYDLREVAFDRTFAGELVQALQGEGIRMVAFGQGFLSMAAPAAELERMVRGRMLAHGGHPVLRWNAANCAVRQDAAGNIKPDKEFSTERIDGVVALLMALGRATLGQESVYNDRGLTTLGSGDDVASPDRPPVTVIGAADGDDDEDDY